MLKRRGAKKAPAENRHGEQEERGEQSAEQEPMLGQRHDEQRKGSKDAPLARGKCRAKVKHDDKVQKVEKGTRSWAFYALSTVCVFAEWLVAIGAVLFSTQPEACLPSVLCFLLSRRWDSSNLGDEQKKEKANLGTRGSIGLRIGLFMRGLPTPYHWIGHTIGDGVWA